MRQAQYAAQVSAADLENERLTEQASLAEYFFEIRGQDQLQKIFNDTVEADQKTYDLTRALYDAGIDDQISVVEAETTLRSAQAGATNVGIARAQYEHAIAVLIGKTASNFSIPVKPMTTAPPPIPVGVPSELLERRPDIAAAERTMAEANAAIGIAYAAYYPNLTLTGEGGFESSSFSHWLVLAEPILVGWRIAFLKLSSTPGCAALPSSNTLQPTMRISPLPPDGAYCIPTGGRCSCRSSHPVERNPAGTAGGEFRANLPKARTGPVRDRHRPLHRRADGPNHRTRRMSRL